MKSLLFMFLLLCLDYSQSQSLSLKEDETAKRNVPDQNKKRIVCYYASWAVYRANESKFTPADIDPHLCTHVLYAFATLNSEEGLMSFDPHLDLGKDGFKKFTQLKKSNPDLQLILSVGGIEEGSSRFTQVAADPTLRSRFASKSRAFLEQFGFDGLDLSWQYPGFTEGSSSKDKENYVLLVKDIRKEFKNDLGLSMVVPSKERLIEVGVDLSELAKYLDFMNIVTYDYHEPTAPTVNHVAPLYTIPKDHFNKDWNVDYTIRTYLSLGVDPSMINMGIPLYGVSYILENPEETDIGSKAEDEGPVKGALTYNQICKKIKEELWTVRHVNKTAMGPYAYKDNRWVAYDDEDIIRNKGKYAADKKLGGIMFWAIDMDDFKGLYHSRTYPLIKAGREAFLDKSMSGDSSQNSASSPTTS